MKAADVQKVLAAIQDLAADSFDHMAARFADGVEKLGDEYAHLADFSASWNKLSKGARRLVVEQLLKSSGLVMAGTVATKAGLKVAGKTQKQIRNVILNVADLVEPTGKKAKKKAKKLKKDGGKKAKKLKKDGTKKAKKVKKSLEKALA